MKKILAILLCLVMAFTFGACNMEGFHLEGDATGSICPITNADDNPSFDEMIYYHYDYDAFVKYAEETMDLIEKASEKDVNEIAERIGMMFEAYDQVDTLRELANARYMLDVTEDYWAGEVEYIDSFAKDMNIKIGEVFLAAADSKVAGKIADALELEEGETLEGTAEYFKNMDAADVQETRIINEYYRLVNDLAENDVETEIYREITEKLIELVNYRNEQARAAGYENYVEEAMDDPGLVPIEDVGALSEILLANREVYDGLADNEILDTSEKMKFDFYGAAEVKSAMENFLLQVDSKMADYFSEFYERGLFILAEGEKSSGSGYTTTLTTYLTPLVYNYLEHDLRGLTDSLHEFGHAYASHLTLSRGEDYGVYYSDIALSEVQSSGLEALLLPRYEAIYGKDGKKAKAAMMEFMLNGVIDSAAEEKFERTLYEAKDLTVDDVCRIYSECMADFGFDITEGAEEPDAEYLKYGFVHANHPFDQPIYQQNYELAYFAAIQLHLQAEDDFDAAAKKYRIAADCGDTGLIGYKELMKKMGFADISKKGEVEKVLKDYCKMLTDLEAEI